MPLVDTLCRRKWLPPEDAGAAPERSGEQGTTLKLVSLMETDLPSILREIDSNETVRSSDIRINFGTMHRCARNATDVEIIIQPGTGNNSYTNQEQGQRRVKVRDAVRDRVVRFYHDYQDRTLLPDLSVEISVGGGFSGFWINADGRGESWD